MCVGEKRILKVPSAMGYGSKGAGGVIPPEADLIFEVELITINNRTKNQKLKADAPPEEIRGQGEL